MVLVSNPEVIYFSPATLLSTTAEGGDQDIRHGHAASWDLPSNDVIHPIADAVIDAIEANGIEPRDIVLSGYDRNECPDKVNNHKIEEFSTTGRESIQSRIHEIAQEMAAKYDDGTLSPSAQKAGAEEIKALREQIRLTKETPNLAAYFFAGHIAMHDNYTGDKNPVFYAGSGSGSTIGVYDRKRLQALADARVTSASTGFEFLNDKEGVHFLDATRQEIESAKVMECHIHYGPR